MNLFDLMATIRLDSSEYEQGLDDAQKSASSFGDKLGKALSTIGKVSAAAMGVAAAGVTAITKSAVDSYADYEQLVGGIETLFGDAAGSVMADADKAFKTAGLSANSYMETSIQSAAALINSLGGDQARAAELMNMSITDMADNVNKMGTSMEAVQNAYRGFSRGNFTMLDNLALGFAGTKEGMEQLLQKAQEFSGVEYDIESYSDIVQAIHVVQDEMGITGTTAKEASETISGSAASVKSAWQNLITGLGNDNADIEKLISDLIGSVETTIGNIVPVVQKILTALGKALKKSAPSIFKTFTEIATNMLPELVSTASDLLSALMEALINSDDLILQAGLDIMLTILEGMASGGEQLSATIGSLIESIGIWIGEYSGVIVDGIVNVLLMIAQVIIDNAPVLAERLITVIAYLAEALVNPENMAAMLTAVMTIIQTVADSILENVGTLVDITLTVLDSVVGFIIDNLPMFLDTAIQIIMALVDGFIEALPDLLDYLPTVIDSIVDALLNMLPQLVEAGVQLLTALINKLPYIIDVIVEKMPSIIDNIIKALIALLPEIIQAGITLLTALVNNMPVILNTIVEALPVIITAIVNGIAQLLPVIVQAGISLFVALIRNLPAAITEIVQHLPEIITAIVNGIVELVPQLWQAGKDLIAGLWNGINNAKEWLREKISGFFGGVVDSIKAFFGIKSPSKLFAGIGEMLDRGLAKGVEDYAGLAVDAAEGMADEVFDATNRDYDFTATGNVDANGNPVGRWNAPIINVYGADGQNVEELADAVSQRIAFVYSQEQAVWA